ncbi:transcriptional regulator [Amycolatopsis antarctica]|uniref:Transcriptional regulator n=1 Tax=Amycolatopsis antarctica TaxID=1854586 RepID=A0A263D628_9PSEU|nr:helix-turn-helix transcriptional regulator [Amycolatopsis antarctica]OZM73964.1 transcriptional regulator [Amycolatopsis antarctica]
MTRTTEEGGPAATSRDRTLAGVLRDTWERRKRETGMSLRALGDQVGVSHASLSRWFKGQVVPSYEGVVSVVAALGVVGEEKEMILTLARNPGPNLVTTGPPGVSQQLAGVMELERTASSMTVWSPLQVPGLLQSRAYAQAVIGAGGKLTQAEVDYRLTLRLGRQHAIVRDDPIKLSAVLGVPAIQARVGGAEVMADQLRYLLRVADFPAVTLQVAPVDGDWHGGLHGSFLLYEFEGQQSHVHMENHRTGQFVDSSDDVEGYAELADELRQLAYSDADTKALIRDQINKLETTA